MFVSRETEGDLSEDGSSERLFHRGSAPGPCGLSRLGGYIQSMRGKFVCRRADGNAAGLRLGPRCLFMGPTRPRQPSLPPTAALPLRLRSRARFWRGLPGLKPPGASKVSRFGTWLSGLPAPDPGNFLYAQKVTKKAPGTPWPRPPSLGLRPIHLAHPDLSNRSALRLILRSHRITTPFGHLICGWYFVPLRLTAS